MALQDPATPAAAAARLASPLRCLHSWRRQQHPHQPQRHRQQQQQLFARRRRPHEASPPRALLRHRPQSFIGSIDLVPGWLMPSWLSPEPSSPRDEVRQQRLKQLRSALKASARQPPLLLPLPPGEEAGALGEDASGGSGTIDLANTASNAVPFCPGTASGLGTVLAGGSASTIRAEEARQVLPWLFAAEGRLDFTAMEGLASQLALSGLQLLDVTRFASASSAANGHWHGSWGAHVRWVGPQPLPSPAVAAAAALRRMELRRGGALTGLPEMEGKAVVLTFHPHHRQLAAEALAIYLHAYLGLSGREAVEAAGRAVGTSPLECTLRRDLEELATIADGWYRRVTLAWPYAGGHVEVVGDAVGGWDQRAPMVFNVKKKRWQLQIWGLQPGIHRFKYLVDGCWVIDLAGHTEADARGNINNVVMVTSTGKPLLRFRSSGSSSDEDDGELEEDQAGSSNGSGSGGSRAASNGSATAQASAAAVGNVLATAEPPEAASEDGEDSAQQQQAAEEVLPPWSGPEEMEGMARFGAAILAFHTRLGVQLRHKLHH